MQPITSTVTATLLGMATWKVPLKKAMGVVFNDDLCLRVLPLGKIVLVKTSIRTNSYSRLNSGGGCAYIGAVPGCLQQLLIEYAARAHVPAWTQRRL